MTTPEPNAGVSTPLQLWTTLRAVTDLLELVARREATLDRNGWSQVAGQLLAASSSARVMAELAQPPMEVRADDG